MKGKTRDSQRHRVSHWLIDKRTIGAAGRAVKIAETVELLARLTAFLNVGGTGVV